MANKSEFDADGFYAALERAMRARTTTWSDISKSTGVSSTTLTRMGQGRRPDAASMAALSAWAGINPADYVERVFPANTGTATLERVCLLFRQDAQLSDEARKKLELIVESAYNALKEEPKKEPAKGD